MQLPFDQMLEKVTEFLQNEAKTQTIIGEQFQLGEFFCVPVIRTGMGFGSGAGEGEDKKNGHGEGGGLGAGLGIEPIGFLVSRDDQISFISTHTNKGLAATFEKVPDLLEKFMNQRAKATKKETSAV